MGYDVCLVNKDGPVLVPRHNEGSYRQCGKNGSEGTTAAEISVTGNYDMVYHQVTDKSLGDMLDGRIAKDTLPDLAAVVKACGTITHKDYWKPTPGNAGAIAAMLLDWASLHPYAIWEVNA